MYFNLIFNIMKNLFLAFLFIFISALTFGQKQFEGMWVSMGSSYVNTIIADSKKIIKVVNISLIENEVYEEKILSQNQNVFYTKIYNEQNGYEAFVKYKLEGEFLVCEYTGDFEDTVYLFKLDLTSDKYHIVLEEDKT